MKKLTSVLVMAIGVNIGVCNLAMAEAISVDGVTYEDVQWGAATPVTISIRHRTGAATIRLEKLSPELQRKFGYDVEKARQWEKSRQETLNQKALLATKIALSKQWNLTIFEIVDNAVLAYGAKTSDYVTIQEEGLNGLGQSRERIVQAPQSMYILLVGHPQQKSLGVSKQICVYAYPDGVAKLNNDTYERWVYCEPPTNK